MSYADEYDKPYEETTKDICNILNIINLNII